MSEEIKIPKDDLIEFLWGVCLSDHLGDVMYEVSKVAKLIGINGELDQEDLLNEMKKRDMIPDYQRD